MKKYILFFISLLIINISFVYAKDITSYTTVTSLTIQKNDGTELDLDKGDDPNNYSNGLDHNEYFGITFSLTVDMGSSAVIESGDTITLSLNSQNYSTFAWADTSNVTITNNNGDVGYFKHTGNNIIITFNDNAQGLSTINTTIKTSKQIRRVGTRPNDELRYFYLGNKSVRYKAIRQILVASNDPGLVAKAVYSTSDSTVDFRISVGGYIEKRLTEPGYATNRADSTWVQNTLYFSNIYIEDTISDATNVVVSRISAQTQLPVADDDPSASLVDTPNYVITEAFTELVPNVGESFESFKARIKSQELQYGVYQKDETTFVFMIYLGDFPNSKLAYKDFDIYNKVAGLTTDWWTDGRKALWLQTHAEDNCINGLISKFAIRLLVDYLPVVSTVDKVNYVDYVYNDNVARQARTTATLSPISIESHIPTRNVNLYLFDEDSKSVINNSKFKLFRLVNDEWTPYNGEYTTNDDGKIEVTNLPNGSYKFEQTLYHDNYEEDSSKYYLENLDNEITTDIQFEITSSDTEGYVIYVSNKKKETTDEIEDNNNTTGEGDTNETSVLGESETITNNPKTGDTILKYIIYISISLGFIFYLYKNKQSVRNTLK